MLRKRSSGKAPASYAKGRGFESTLRFHFDGKKIPSVSGARLSFRYVTHMLRLYAVTRASGNTSANFSCRFKGGFQITYGTSFAKPEYIRDNKLGR